MFSTQPHLVTLNPKPSTLKPLYTDFSELSELAESGAAYFHSTLKPLYTFGRLYTDFSKLHSTAALSVLYFWYYIKPLDTEFENLYSAWIFFTQPKLCRLGVYHPLHL